MINSLLTTTMCSMDSNSTSTTQLTSQLPTFNTETQDLKITWTVMSRSMVMDQKKNITMKIFSIHNSQDMLRSLIPTTRNFWFCINALKQLIITTRIPIQEFQEQTLGTMPKAQALISAHGQRQSINLTIRLK